VDEVELLLASDLFQDLAPAAAEALILGPVRYHSGARP
jgi:hypothetical protein